MPVGCFLSLSTLSGCAIETVMATNNGDVLMLEAAPEATKPWASAANAEVIDALPYIDDDYGNPLIKAEVDRLVEEEMRRSSKKPADFLKDLPPLPKFDFEVNFTLYPYVSICLLMNFVGIRVYCGLGFYFLCYVRVLAHECRWFL